MSRVLRELLSAQEPAFSSGLKQLESSSGHPGIDVRLVAELSATIRKKLRELGLDPEDTTPRELYHSLQATLGRHDAFIANALGVADPQDVAALLPKIQQQIVRMDSNMRCWVIKGTAAKKLLKAHPPKKVMKLLGYRSIDSLLKREHIGELFTATRFIESQQWQTKFIKSYKKLSSSDFETRDIEVIVLDAKRWGQAATEYIYQNHHNISHSKEMGVILILPLPIDRLRGITLTVMPMVLHYITEIRMYSALFKLKQVRADFSAFLVRTLLDDPTQAAVMAGQQVHWKTIAKHFGRRKSNLPDVFQPHVQAEDLVWRKSEDILYYMEPALQFWAGMDFVGLTTPQGVISFNLMDNAISYCNGLEFGQQVQSHMQSSLWNELFMRYMSQDLLEQEVLAQLGDEQIIDDLIAIGA